MRTVRTSEELIEAVLAGEECQLLPNLAYIRLGKLTSLEGVHGAIGAQLHSLVNITSLDGFVGAKSIWLRNLSNLRTLEGFVGHERMRLGGMYGIKSLNGFTGVKDMSLQGLLNLETLGDYTPKVRLSIDAGYKLEVKPASITDEEIAILNQIPLDKIEPLYLYNGEDDIHRLTEWVQIIKGESVSAPTADRDAYTSIPNMSPYYSHSGENTIKFLKSLR